MDAKIPMFALCSKQQMILPLKNTALLSSITSNYCFYDEYFKNMPEMLNTENYSTKNYWA